MLQELAASNLKLPVVYVPDDEVFAVREHLRARSDLVSMSTMVKNRIHALLVRRGILRPEKLNVFTKAGRAYLAELPLDEAGRTILDRDLSSLDQLTATIAASQKSLRELARRDRWRRPCALLMSMPGVGLVTALVVLSELGDLSRFASRSAVSNFAGLVPKVRDSNETVRRGHITKRGSSHLRHVLIEAAWTASGRSPRYADLLSRVSAPGGGGKQVGIVAVARRMLEDAFMLLKKDEPFREGSPAVGEPTRCDEASSPQADSALPQVGEAAASSHRACRL